MAERAASRRADLAPAIGSALLVILAIFESAPLGFLPPMLRWPLCLAGVVALWSPRLKARGVRLPSWALGALEAAALALIFGTWGLLKVIGLHPSDTDDNIYFYMARRFADGAWPYRDFFFAHPPVHLIVPALVFKVFGFSIPLAKSIPVLAQTLAGTCLYIYIRPASRPLALVALLLHLSAYEVLMGSTDMDGENLMTAFLLAAILCASRQRFLPAGLLAGLALGTGLYALAGVLALFIACAGSSRRALAWFGLGLAGCVALWGGAFAAIGGSGFLDGVFRYHLAKAPSADHWPLFATANPLAIAQAYLHDLGAFLASRTLRKSLFFHTPLYLAAIGGVVLALAAWLKQPKRKLLAAPLSGTPEGLALLGGLGALLFLLQWPALNEVYDFYLVPMTVLMALPAAYALVRIVALASEGGRAQLAWSASLAAILCCQGLLARTTHDGLWPEEIRDRGQVASYPWRDPMILQGPAQLTRALFFRDHRIKAELLPPYVHYLWNKSLSLSLAPQIAAYVEGHTSADETLTGASTLAPLVALLSHRRLAADEADTNNKRFRSGMISDRVFWERVCADRLRYVLSAPNSRFTDEYLARDATARRFFERELSFDEPAVRHFRSERFGLYRRRELATADGRACAFADDASRR